MSEPCLNLERLYVSAADDDAICEALDYLYDEVEDALVMGLDAEYWPSVTALLEQVDMERLAPEIMVGILTITLPVHTRLIGRAAFLERTEKKLVDMVGADQTARILEGLT